MSVGDPTRNGSPPASTTGRRAAGCEVVAVVPCAGRGTRLVGRPCSKELLPLAYTPAGPGESGIKVVSQSLFERMAAAGIRRGVVVLRDGKWDIPGFYGQGGPAGMHLSYVVVGDTAGPPDSVARAAPAVRDCVLAFGFPDILLEPPNAYDQLLSRLDRADADLVLGLYPVRDRAHSDVVQLATEEEGERVEALFLKDVSKDLPWCWACAVWSPVFTAFLEGLVAEVHRFGAGSGRFAGLDAGGDMPMGFAFQCAVEAGLRVVGVPFAGATWVDVGTPARLAEVAFRSRNS